MVLRRQQSLQRASIRKLGKRAVLRVCTDSFLESKVVITLLFFLLCVEFAMTWLANFQKGAKRTCKLKSNCTSCQISLQKNWFLQKSPYHEALVVFLEMTGTHTTDLFTAKIRLPFRCIPYNGNRRRSLEINYLPNATLSCVFNLRHRDVFL